LHRLEPDAARTHGQGRLVAGVHGVFPTITYPTHATISTGAHPTRHGVLDNGLAGVWFKERSHVKLETLWDAAKRAGRSVAIVTWPSTYGANADWLVPEDLDNFADPTAAIRAGSTPGLFDALQPRGAPRSCLHPVTRRACRSTR
jgi:predicted AlkP superfamily phosphohydrolase/phosphomutase